MAASSKTLGQLHELFAQYWMDQMTRTDENERIVPLTAAEAAVLRAFLKDNDITADPDKLSEVDALRQKLSPVLTDVPRDELDAVFADFEKFGSQH